MLSGFECLTVPRNVGFGQLQRLAGLFAERSRRPRRLRLHDAPVQVGSRFEFALRPVDIGQRGGNLVDALRLRGRLAFFSRQRFLVSLRRLVVPAKLRIQPPQRAQRHDVALRRVPGIAVHQRLVVAADREFQFAA